MNANAGGIFHRPPHSHLPAVKDILVVTLVLGLIVGFLISTLNPGPNRGETGSPAAVAVI